MTKRQGGSLAILVTLGVTAVLVHAGCGRTGAPGAPGAPEVEPLAVTYYYLPG